MLHYLIQTLLFQIIFLMIYDLFYKKNTFFNWNRGFLITTPLLSLALPLIKIEELAYNDNTNYVATIERIITASSENIVSMGTTQTSITDTPINWWIIIYTTGIIIHVFLIVLQLHKLQVLKSFATSSLFGNKKIIILPNSNLAFSFWNTIYIGDQLKPEEKEHILIHEQIHVDQKHSLDQIYFEILKIILWWNPLIRIVQSKITVLHEYIADQEVILKVNKRNYVEQLLNSAFQTEKITFVNQFFNQSLIKKRILMLQKTKSKAITKLHYLLLLPLVLGMLTYSSCTDNKNSDSSEIKDCINSDAKFDKSLNNYLKIITDQSSEVIVRMVHTETSEVIRTNHIGLSEEYLIRHIPAGKYHLDISYGTEYTEEEKNGKCIAYFKKETMSERDKNILDYNTINTPQGLNVPSYSMNLSVKTDYHNDHENQDQYKQTNTEEGKSREPACPNQNSGYDKSLDNYLKVVNDTETEIIVNLISINTSKTTRVVHLAEKGLFYIRNIPEDKYKLHIYYGTGYDEKIEKEICKAFFKNEIKFEEDKSILDFNTLKSERGLDVPSYTIKLDLTESI